MNSVGIKYARDRRRSSFGAGTIDDDLLSATASFWSKSDFQRPSVGCREVKFQDAETEAPTECDTDHIEASIGLLKSTTCDFSALPSMNRYYTEKAKALQFQNYSLEFRDLIQHRGGSEDRKSQIIRHSSNVSTTSTVDAMSDLHLQGRCKPCAFFYSKTKPCTNGDLCVFCHHEDHAGFTAKQWKKQRRKFKDGRLMT